MSHNSSKHSQVQAQQGLKALCLQCSTQQLLATCRLCSPYVCAITRRTSGRTLVGQEQDEPEGKEPADTLSVSCQLLSFPDCRTSRSQA